MADVPPPQTSLKASNEASGFREMNAQELARFLRMLKMGISVTNVYNEMDRDGFDPEVPSRRSIVRTIGLHCTSKHMI